MKQELDFISWKLDISANNNSSKISLVKTPSRRFKKFIGAPLPYEWITGAAKLPGKSLHVAMAIRYMAGLSKKKIFMLAHKPVEEFGVGTKAMYHALLCLEDAGLIAVQRHIGKAPRITILDISSDIKEAGED